MRFHDPEIVNRVANIPEVAAYLGADSFDFTIAIGKPENIFLQQCGGKAIALCEWSAPRVYECHLIFHPECKGRDAINASRIMGDYMLAFHANMLWGRPQVKNRPAIWHIRQAGFSAAGFGDHPGIGAVQYFVRSKPCPPQ